MKVLNPPGAVMGFRKEMDRLFDRLWDRDFPDLPTIGEWVPTLDMTETKEAFLVKAEVPGVDPKDVHVTLQDQVLTIRGDKKQQHEEKDEQFYRNERVYGMFTRALRLPVPVEAKLVKATFTNGVLTVTMPKALAPNGTSIPVTPI